MAFGQFCNLLLILMVLLLLLSCQHGNSLHVQCSNTQAAVPKLVVLNGPQAFPQVDAREVKAAF